MLFNVDTTSMLFLFLNFFSPHNFASDVLPLTGSGTEIPRNTESELSARLRDRGRVRKRVAAIASSTPGPECRDVKMSESRTLATIDLEQ